MTTRYETKVVLYNTVDAYTRSVGSSHFSYDGWRVVNVQVFENRDRYVNVLATYERPIPDKEELINLD